MKKSIKAIVTVFSILYLLFMFACPPPDPGNDSEDELLDSDDIPVDIRADVNRNGIVEENSSSEDVNEESWNSGYGAIFLANLDDDEDAFPDTGSDAVLAAGHDASDEIINGLSDLEDLARIKLVAWSSAPESTTGILSVNTEATGFIRIFKNNGTVFEHLPLPAVVSIEEIRNGLELGIEARDIVRDDSVWDGYVTVTYQIDTISDTGFPISSSDSVLLRTAPVVFSHSLADADTLLVSSFVYPSSVAFRDDLSAALTAAGIANPLTEFANTGDQWTGDFLRPAFMSMPSEEGQHIIRFYFRSSNYTSGSLRPAGRVVYTELRGPDAAGCVEYDPDHPDSMDTLNSLSNFIVIPPYSYDGTDWPNGRILRGGEASIFYPDEDFDLMLSAQGADSTNSQGIQDIVYAEIDWLLNGHISEVVNFVPYDGAANGWVMLIADPVLGFSMLTDAFNDGNGSAEMFDGMEWSGGSPADIRISDFLSDTDLLDANNWAVGQLDNLKTQIISLTGISEDDIISVPALFLQEYGYLVNCLPSLVSGICMNDEHYAAPETHGPVIEGEDIFKTSFDSIMAGIGKDVTYVENWDLYHGLYGTLQMGAAVQYDIDDLAPWWESSL